MDRTLRCFNYHVGVIPVLSGLQAFCSATGMSLSRARCFHAAMAADHYLEGGIRRSGLDLVISWCCGNDALLDRRVFAAFLLEHSDLSGIGTGGVCH